MEHHKDAQWQRQYARFAHGALIIDCLEYDLRAELGYNRTNELSSLYGAYRQVMCGDNTTPAPSVFSIESRSKWEAWTELKGLSQKEAVLAWLKQYKQFYIQFPHLFARIPNSNLEAYEPFGSNNQTITGGELKEENEDENEESEEHRRRCSCDTLDWLKKRKAKRQELKFMS